MVFDFVGFDTGFSEVCHDVVNDGGVGAGVIAYVDVAVALVVDSARLSLGAADES